MRMIAALLHLLTTPRPRAGDDELLAVATAVGATRTAPGAHRPGPGRRMPGWLRLPPFARKAGNRGSALHAVGVVLTALGTGAVGAVVALGLTSAPAAALVGIPVGVVAAAVVR